MARKPMVTRTLKSTKATILCVNTDIEEITTIEVTLPRTYKDNREIVKILEKNNLIPDNLKLVSVKATEIIEAKYGMPESDFIKYATPIADTDETSEN